MEEKGKDFLKGANEKIRVFASNLTSEQLGVITYIYECLPYDNRERIVEY